MSWPASSKRGPPSKGNEVRKVKEFTDNFGMQNGPDNRWKGREKVRLETKTVNLLKKERTTTCTANSASVSYKRANRGGGGVCSVGKTTEAKKFPITKSSGIQRNVRLDISNRPRLPGGGSSSKRRNTWKTPKETAPQRGTIQKK